MIAGGAAIAMALIPGMPVLPCIGVGLVLLFSAQRIKSSEAAREASTLEAEQASREPTSESPEDLMERMRVHALEILLAPDLVNMVSGASDDLLARVRALRRTIAMDLGIIVPPVRTRDSIDLPSSTYVIRISGVEAGRGLAPSGKVLALGDSLDALPGLATVEPVFGLAGKWVPQEMRHSAEMTGATVIDRVSVVVTHLSSIITNNAARLVSREDVRMLTESIKQVNPSAVDELTPSLLSLAEIQRVLQGLLAEQVPINDLSRIYEALALRAKVSTEAEGLIEAARQALGPALSNQYLDGRTLRVIMIDPMLEQSMLEAMRPSELGTQILLDQKAIEALFASLNATLARVQANGQSAVLVCAPALRPAIHRLVSGQANSLPVLSYQEAGSANVTIETVGVIGNAESISTS